MIIGISGKAQAGKDTVCNMLSFIIWYNQLQEKKRELSFEYWLECRNYEEYLLKETDWVHSSFAAPLKGCLALLLNCDKQLFENQDFKQSTIENLIIDNIKPTVRELLQKFGTAIRNEICDDFWVQILFYNITNNCLISDVRFKSEAEGIKDRNGIIIRVNRDSAGAGKHISEVDLDDYNFDYIIDNNESLEDLFNKVLNLSYKIL